ncbi:MAG: ion transporter [Chitinophagaceae bacterium]|nr:ion transporter [Chitinophagaceae bacterium]MBK8310279.1 ion transporter [Chitinophagaceae bacterium]MBP6477163.1 ion transporter [Chitinophagaceae bacterium]MBP7109037.1 ion transporter [Chitinophagaceae bacterium]MBP7316323.1 ion transporter [Chitinophagaceae bacterium]
MYKVTKKKVHGLLHPEIVGDERWDKIINVFIIVLIILNVVAVILETVKSINNRYEEFFHYFDWISVIIFTIEYILRVWSSNHEEKYKHSVWGRLKYMFSAGALIDLIAIAPSYMHSIIGIDLRVLRMMRLMRLFRLFRLTAYMKSAQMITNVFKKRANELALTFILAALLIIIASCIIYFTEHLYPTEKTSLFTSIPATIWWAIVTLTTTGYGDMIPLTDLGKFMSGIIMLTGVAFFALPAGIITAGFLEEFRINRIKKTHKCPNCGEDLNLENNHHHDENGK